MIMHAIIFLVLAGLGVFTFLKSRKTAARIKAAAGWPRVPGSITAADIRRHESTDAQGRLSVSFSPAVSYSFEHAGERRTGSRIYVGEPKIYSTLGGARKALAAYPVGGAVEVSVDPDDSANTALTVGGGTNLSAAIILWVIAVISLVVGPSH